MIHLALIWISLSQDLSQEEKTWFSMGQREEFHFHYENEFGGVRDIEIPFEGS